LLEEIPMKPSLLALVSLSTLASCVVDPPPPPTLTVTSPERGQIQSEAGEVRVQGIAQPGPDGAAVTRVMINGEKAQLAADGSFSAIVQVPAGVMLLETEAFSAEGARAIDARALHVGERRPVGSRIDRALTATLSTEAFAAISTAASQALSTLDFSTLLAPVSIGGSTANVKLTIAKLGIGGVDISLVPVDNGLQLAVEITGLDVDASAAYAGSLVPDGSTMIKVTAERIAISGTLGVTADATGKFKTTIASPTITTTAMKLQASGVIGTIVDLLQSNLLGFVRGIASKSVESALEPLINKALASLGGPKSFSVLNKSITLDASPADIQFTGAGALASMNLAAHIGGGEASPGYIFTPNGAPEMDVSRGLEVAISDDLLNDMLAQIHAMRLLDLRVEEDFGLFDVIDLKPMLPPMISANTADGKVRLVLGDMIGTVSNKGSTLVKAAVNASVDVKISSTDNAQDIAIELGEVHLVANLLDDPENPSQITAQELQGAANAGIGLKLPDLEKFLVTVPVPSISGVGVSNLSLHGDGGYVVLGAQVQ
jgi:hypothetical protein